MITSLTLSLHHVLTEVEYHIHAVWQDDAEAEPVVLERGGQAPAYGLDSHIDLLAAVLAAERAEHTARLRQQHRSAGVSPDVT